MKNANKIKISATIIETGINFFSIIFFIVAPKLPIKKAIIKNLKPLVKKDTIIK